MAGSHLIDRLREGRRVFGIHVMHDGGPAWLHALAGLNSDFVFIDTEHTPVDRSSIALMCRSFSGYGISPSVRIPCPDLHLASQAWDAGAEGVVVPYVESADEIRDIAALARHRPLKGRYLSEVASGKRRLNDETAACLHQRNQNNYLLIGIESVPAIENLDELLNVEGVDGVFIGPHDLSISMEMPEQYADPEYIKTVERIIAAARISGKSAGMHLKPEIAPEPVAKQYFEAGLNWILFSHDATILLQAANESLNRLRVWSGDAPRTDESGGHDAMPVI